MMKRYYLSGIRHTGRDGQKKLGIVDEENPLELFVEMPYVGRLHNECYVDAKRVVDGLNMLAASENPEKYGEIDKKSLLESKERLLAKIEELGREYDNCDDFAFRKIHCDGFEEYGNAKEMIGDDINRCYSELGHILKQLGEI